MIGDYYTCGYYHYYVVIKETDKTKTLLRFEPDISDSYKSKYSDPCNRDLEVRGILEYMDETVIIRLCKDGYWKHKGEKYKQFKLPYYDHTNVDC